MPERSRFFTPIASTLLAICVSMTAFSEMPIPENPLWETVPDDVFLQETGRSILTDTPINAVAVLDGELFAGTKEGVQKLQGDAFIDEKTALGPVSRLKALDGVLWAISETGLWRRTEGVWKQLDDNRYTDLCLHGRDVIVTSPGQVFRVEGDRLVAISAKPTRSTILGVASYSETIYVRHANRLSLLENGRFEYEYGVQDWGYLPLGSTTRGMLSFGSRLFVPTNKGLAVLRGMSWSNIVGEDGLCYEDTTCVAPGFDRDFWIGTTRGAIRAVKGEYQFFGHERWIPHNKVNDIVCGERVVYIATDSGLGIIDYEPYTLLKKAAWYSRWLEEHGQKRLGFVHDLLWDEKRKEYVRFLGDNDLSWACHYLNALCFRYAVTKDPAVREEAVDVFKTIKWSEEITPIPGFPARAIHVVGEDAVKATTGSAGLPAEWTRTEDGLFEWKGDTSSDEVDAHVYSVMLFYELVAQGVEKAAAKEHLSRVIGHIVDRGWVLRDLDGEPTRWARWDPEYLQRPYGYSARGLNGLEVLAFVTAAYGITEEPKFKQGLQQLFDWGYHDEVLRQKLTFPEVTFFDDHLAFLAYLPLLRYETDPDLRSIYMRSLERSWEIKRIENMPWFSYIYGVLTGNECENRRAVKHLQEWPLDCKDYRFHNSHRSDLQNHKGFRNYTTGWKPMTPRDIGTKRWDRDFMQLDGGGSKRILDPSGWMDVYWMGRYYGLIEPPTATDADVLTVKEHEKPVGAAPYKGPPRPPIFE